MRFHRITLEHFRGVDTESIEFGDGVTIVEGPNEVGKSTVAEAITVLFDHLDSSRRQEVRAVHQIGSDVGPYVELDFSVGDYRISYAKRFLRRPSTRLRITAPEPEQYTGREAHERMGTILKETVDDALWSAMRVAQGGSLRQPDLADVGALRAALDDDGERPAADAEGELMSRVLHEYTRYFTPRTGQPTGELSAAVDEQLMAKQRHDAVLADLETVDVHVRRFAALEAELDRLSGEEQEHTVRLGKLLEQERALEQLRKADTEAAETVTAADTRMREAGAALAARKATISEAAQRRDDCEELGRQAEQLRSTAAERRAAADDAREEARAARTTAQESERAHRVATDAVHTVRLHREVEALDARVARADEARRRLASAESTLASAAIDDESLERLVALDAEVRTAQELLRVGAASIEVEPLGDAPVSVDGTDADTGRRPVLRPTTVTVPDVVRVTVRPGRAGSDLEEDLRRAEHTRDTALAEAGVGDLEAAREAASQRRAASGERELAHGRLRDALGEATDYDALLAQARAARERRDRLESKLGDDTVLPDSAEDAEQRAETIRAGYEEALAAAESRERSAEESERAAVEARESLVRAEQRHESDLGEVRRLERRLADERAAVPDADLDAAVESAREGVESAIAERDRAAAALEAAHPGDLATRLDNARGVDARLSRARRELEDEQQQVTGQLDAFAARGLHDQREAAAAALEQAENTLSRVEARADAARLLHDTLQRHRDTARRRYVAPYKHAVESLGRVVFGDDLSVEIADDLTIASRTSSGRTVAFGSLSGGAREQLAILGRLAAASLVDSVDGAPLVLDDAFGHADPERLERVAAVLNHAGRTTQIIILTCHPERFRAVGSASTVRLGLTRPDLEQAVDRPA